MLHQTPLSWKNLTHDPRRLAAAVCGIGFAVLLMFVQVGFQRALFASQVRLVEGLQGEVFLISPARFALAAEKRFPRTRLMQAQSCPGVQGVYPLYAELATSILKRVSAEKPTRGRPIRSLGYRLGDPVFRLPGVKENERLLREPNTVLIDLGSRKKQYHVPVDEPAQLATTPVELAGRGVRIVGSFSMGPDFVHEGNLVMSAETFASVFGGRGGASAPLERVDIGVVQLRPGADPNRVQRDLEERLPKDVRAFTRAELKSNERRFWSSTTPIGTVFAAGQVLGFVVGVVICYQVIFSDISDHMSEFATLRAMGYGTRYFLGLVAAEAVWLALFGFVPGALVSTALYVYLEAETGLLMRMNGETLLVVLASTLLMCLASSMLAVRKLLTADPANLF